MNMIKRISFAAFIILSIATVCFAATLAGKWNGQMRTPTGDEFPISYQLSVDGDKLNGTVSIPENDLPITDGKIKGDEFSFTVTHQGTSYLNEGQLMGDSLKVKVHFGQEIVESILKREAAK